MQAERPHQVRLGNRPEDDLLDAACIHLTGVWFIRLCVGGDVPHFHGQPDCARASAGLTGTCLGKRENLVAVTSVLPSSAHL
jgi:hypothetical protein